MQKIFSFLLLCCLCVGTSNAKELRIVQIVPFGANNLKITFNQKITLNDLKQRQISATRSSLDFYAILAMQKRNYVFPDKTRVSIKQHSKQIVRLTMISKQALDYKLSFSDKSLYIQLNTKKQNDLESGKGMKTPPKKQISKRGNGRKIVLDAGHGGKDCGAVGVLRVCEKDITLNVTKLLATELKARGYMVYLTRSRDIYLDLRKRTEFANEKNASLFISIHANSVPKQVAKGISGVETYFLSTARSERARLVAEKENKDSIENMNYFSKQSFLNVLSSHRLVASNKLAIDIQSGILTALRKDYQKVLDGGVREGPFWVLAGALMPSVLIEIGYISHPTEGRRINHKDYQILLVEGIANGIDGYFMRNQ